jgi:hypothetical protein
MKLGQMISLDAGDMLPAELTQILARLRDAAHIMPPTQLEKVLATSWGPGWRRRFRRFDARPVAAASIGQVHRAELPDGRVLAIKVQYPGVARSIDSDVDNVATLLKVSGLLPSGLDLAPLLTEAKRQLHEEADYLREAAQMSRYADLRRRPGLSGPASGNGSDRAPCARHGFHRRAIDRHARRSRSGRAQPRHGRAAGPCPARSVRLRLHADRSQFRQLSLAGSDRQNRPARFRSCTPVAERVREGYAALVHSGLHADKEGLRGALIEIGFLSENQFARHGPALDRIIDTILGLLDRADDFDFADRRFTEQIRAEVPSIAADRASWHIPPAETLFVQRKISGTIALAVRMKARLPVKDMVARYDT